MSVAEFSERGFMDLALCAHNRAAGMKKRQPAGMVMGEGVSPLRIIFFFWRSTSILAKTLINA